MVVDAEHSPDAGTSPRTVDRRSPYPWMFQPIHLILSQPATDTTRAPSIYRLDEERQPTVVRSAR